MFVFRLALRLGRTVEELLDALSAAELMEWMAFDRLQPIGDERADVNQAIQTSVLVRMKAKKGARINAVDFLPGWSRQGADGAVDLEEEMKMAQALLHGLEKEKN